MIVVVRRSPSARQKGVAVWPALPEYQPAGVVFNSSNERRALKALNARKPAATGCRTRRCGFAPFSPRLPASVPMQSVAEANRSVDRGGIVVRHREAAGLYNREGAGHVRKSAGTAGNGMVFRKCDGRRRRNTRSCKTRGNFIAVGGGREMFPIGETFLWPCRCEGLVPINTIATLTCDLDSSVRTTPILRIG